MSYETSYDAGWKPFNPDKNRGKWEAPRDFLFACIGHAFKVDAMFVLPSLIFRYVGVYALIPYFLIMIVCTIPIIFMQSFLGQFSSSGFISVFRVSPIFKGVGYLSLAINITTLTYYSIFAAVPLFFFVHSFKPTLPWSCGGTVDWLKQHENRTMVCDLINISEREDELVLLEMPSVDFLKNHLDIDLTQHGKIIAPHISYSWALLLCTFVIWFAVWAVLKNSTETIGRIIRYSTLTMLAILSVCVLRFMFLPSAYMGIIEFLNPSYTHMKEVYVILVPLMALSGLGPGWGSILTMASFNNFKTDVTKNTWVLCVGHFAVMMLASFACIFVEEFLIASTGGTAYLRETHNQWVQFLMIPTGLSLLEMPNFWSLIFFGMVILGATNLLIVQLFSVLTSLFDEFEQLRARRKEIIRIAICVLALASSLFCCNYGIDAFEFITKYSVLTQIFLNLMLLLVVLWIYGRERFQRDVRFMTNRTYPTWMVYIVRFVAPICLLFSFLIGFVIALLESDVSIVIFGVVSLVVLIPWCLIPGYCIFKIMQTRGLLGIRLKRCLQPTEWHPVDPVDRQRYEEAFNNSEVFYQLTTAEVDA